MRKKLYQYYQPNAKDLKDEFGDCTIRALSKALGVTWLEAFDMMIPFCRREQVSNIFGAPIKLRVKLLEELGFRYVKFPRGKDRPTVEEFAKAHRAGTYICNLARHEVAVVSGRYFDTWDCGPCTLYGYFERVRF